MIYRIVILLSLLLPGVTRAQLQLDSKQVSALMRVTHTTGILANEINPAKIKGPMDFGVIPKATTAATATKATTASILYQNTREIPAYEPRHYGVFCRIESRIEKKSTISPRFRLGSSEYVDMLEGKRE